MRAIRAALAGVLILSASGPALAKSVGDGVVPAEIPPNSFTGNYYVDSRGCAFIRAGTGPMSSWIPRANRDLSVVCNQTPTFARATPAPAPQPVAVPQPAPVAVAAPTVTTAPPPAATTTRTTTRRTGRIDWHAFWFGTPRTTTTTVARNPDGPPAPVVTAAAPPPQAVPTRPPAGYYAPMPVYRVPDGETYASRAATPTYVAVTPQGQPAPFAPPGWVSLIDNQNQPQYRGVGTPLGQQTMDLVWTNSMPRKLIDANTGRDVTALFPQLSASAIANRPYIPANGGTTTTTRTSRPDAASPDNMRFRRIEDTSASETDTPTPTATVQPVAGGTYVQVATFGVPANAQRTLATFSAAGLPVAKRPISRGGRQLDIVLIGPFGTDAELAAGLAAARGAGFSDAFAVR